MKIEGNLVKDVPATICENSGFMNSVQVTSRSGSKLDRNITFKL